MGIKANFNRQDLHKVLMQRMERINKSILMALHGIGTDCVNKARSIPKDVGFEDQTGNLRSSIGYVIYQNGSPVDSNFEQVSGSKGDGSEGKSKGERLAKEIAGKYPNGFVLVVVAGMNYALYVESKNRDVLTSAKHLAEQELPRLLDEIREDIKNMK